MITILFHRDNFKFEFMDQGPFVGRQRRYVLLGYEQDALKDIGVGTKPFRPWRNTLRMAHNLPLVDG